MRELYICDGNSNPSDATCVSDHFETDFVQRKGNWAKLVTRHVKIGGLLQMLTIPGELSPENAVGLPRDFDSGASAIGTYYRNPDQHNPGADYMVAPGVLETMLNCSSATPCMFVGLGGDEMGYMVPYDDFRIGCTGDAADCLADFEKGAMTYKDSMSAEACEKIVQDENASREILVSQHGQDTADRVIRTCKYGQTGSNHGEHYEETVAGSWEIVPTYFKSVSTLLDVPVEGRFMSEERDSWQVPRPNFSLPWGKGEIEELNRQDQEAGMKWVRVLERLLSLFRQN
jgi:hypothetical protein